MAKLLNVETDAIYIYPLGGISKFNMPLNINVYKEFLILIMGPVFQNIAFMILIIIFNDYDLILKLHLGILIFNLLPIYPLDGGKVLNIIFTCFFQYKLSYKIGIFISYLVTIVILFSNKYLSINMLLTYVFLIVIIRREDCKINIKYNKFLVERYLNNYKFKKSKVVNNDNNFYRLKSNIVKDGGRYYSEKAYLYKKYHIF